MTNQWMLWILWNWDSDFAVQAIDFWLFATVISLITLTAALSRYFKCQNTFVLVFFFNLYCKCIQTWQAFSKIHLDVKAAVSLISIPNSLNLCLYAFFFFFHLLLRVQSAARLSPPPLGGSFISRGGKEDSNHCAHPRALRLPITWATRDIWQLEEQGWCPRMDSIVCRKISRVKENAFLAWRVLGFYKSMWDSAAPG